MPIIIYLELLDFAVMSLDCNIKKSLSETYVIFEGNDIESALIFAIKYEDDNLAFQALNFIKNDTSDNDKLCSFIISSIQDAKQPIIKSMRKIMGSELFNILEQDNQKLFFKMKLRDLVVDMEF